jgi:fructose-1-phosphate kinase PfkB-like protein
MDTSRAALAAVLAKPEGLWVKVNQLELATGLGLEPGDRPIAQLVEAGQILLDRGAASVVVTLGSAGALAVSHEGAWQATPPPIELVSSVGSGDSMLAGLAVAQLEGQSIDAALAFGVACGSANALNNLPGRIERSEAEALLARTRIGRL